MVEFEEGYGDAVTAAMDALTESGRGWVNLEPAMAEDATPPATPGIFSVFSGTGPAVPLCTWVPPRADQKLPHAEIGIQHKAGPKAARTLAGLENAVPEGWPVLQDHPKRGLVVAVPPGLPSREVLTWLLRAGRALSRVPITTTWRAAIHRGGDTTAHEV